MLTFPQCYNVNLVTTLAAEQPRSAGSRGCQRNVVACHAMIPYSSGVMPLFAGAQALDSRSPWFALLQHGADETGMLAMPQA